MSLRSRIFGLLGRLLGRVKLPQPCEEARNHSSDYIDGELDPVLEQKVRAHISICPLCEAFFRTLRETIAALRAMPTQTVPAGFADRVKNNLRSE